MSYTECQAAGLAALVIQMLFFIPVRRSRGQRPAATRRFALACVLCWAGLLLLFSVWLPYAEPLDLQTSVEVYASGDTKALLELVQATDRSLRALEDFLRSACMALLWAVMVPLSWCAAAIGVWREQDTAANEA